MWVLMWAAAALCTCIGVQIFLWKWWLFLAFHTYHKVNKFFYKERFRSGVIYNTLEGELNSILFMRKIIS